MSLRGKPFALTASQGTVVPPQAVTLTWNCDPNATVADSCSITGGSTDLAGQPVSGSATVAPSQNTTYTLSCATKPGTPPPPPQTSTVQISVQGPNVHETNP